MKIHTSRLTNCCVSANGGEIGLDFIDAAGVAVTVQLSLEQAEAVVMTLPRLLASALKQKTGNDDARYVFGLGEWSMESAKGQACLIATLKTTDGFEVSFGIPFEACRSLGWNLLQGADRATAGDACGQSHALCGMKLN